MTLSLTVLIGVVTSIIATELLALCPTFTTLLLNAAANRIPVMHRDRYQREWLGDFDALRASRGNLAIVCWAMGVYLSSQAVARIIGTSETQSETQSDTAHLWPQVRAERPFALAEPPESFYADLLRLDVAPDVVFSTLLSITRDPGARLCQTVNGIRVYMQHVSANTLRTASKLVLAYTYSEPLHLVRPLLIASCDGTNVRPLHTMKGVYESDPAHSD